MAVTTRLNSVSQAHKVIMDCENADVQLNGKVSIITRGNNQRGALGDVRNKVTQVEKKVLKKDVEITKKPIQTRSHAQSATSIRASDKLNKENDQVALTNAIELMPAPVTCGQPTTISISNVVENPMDISEDRPDAFSKALLFVQNIDANDKESPQLVSEYVNEIYAYMRFLEREQAVSSKYLEGQEITAKMRSILIDWLCQVHHRFHLLQETLYLTVSVIDRFLQVHPVKRNKLQLIGVTAMLIASKYEEMFAPEVADFVYITDNAYSKADIRQMEGTILQTLDFRLGKPLCLHFLRRNSKAGQVDATKHTLAKYLMELTIVDYEMVHYTPSIIAAAALCLAMKLLDNSKWTPTLVYYSTYPEQELHPIMCKLASLIVKGDTCKLTAVRVKYQSSKFEKISLRPELKSQVVRDLAAAHVPS